MRLSKQTTCNACTTIIRQMPVVAGDTIVGQCRSCGHLQELEIVPAYEWEERGNVTRAVETGTQKCIASISHGIGGALYSVNGGEAKEAKSVEEAKAAVEDLLNGTTDH